MAVEVMLLGTVGLRHDGVWHAPSSGLMRALLAVLAASDEEVSASALIETVWRGRAGPPREATVAVAVHRLRRWLVDTVGDAARITLPTSGYLLEVPGGGTDLGRFRERVARARQPGVDESARADLMSDALAVWRGPALVDVPLKFAQDALVSQLEGERLAVTLDLGRTLRRLGRSAWAVELLTATARRHPLDELVQALLIEVLGDAGRQAEALRTYRSVRDRLVDELGVEPGPDLHRAYLDVLRRVPATTPVASETPAPAQLPADIPHFTGREDALRAIDLHSGRHGGEPVGVSVLTGTAGVGKTALARRWAHRSRDRFPDGQLFVDLRGYADGAPADPLDVLGGFLRALGAAADEVPTGLAEASAAYRTRLADRRVLVVLDNARSAEQVRPLLPGSASCHVVVTSRAGLAGLVAVDGARQVRVGPLTAAQAGRLLSGLLGEGRVRAEAAAARDLAAACAYLPLALRIVCAELSFHPEGSLADRVSALNAADRFAALAPPGDERAGLAAALRHSYDVLPPDAGRMFRLLGTARVHDVTATAAAALCGVSPDAARPLLTTLADASLMEEHRPGRYAFHDLLRDYAATLPDPERAAARTRLQDWYLARCGAVTQLLYPHFWRMERAEDADAPTDREEALRWLDDERANFVAVAGDGPHAWRIADALRAYLTIGGHHTEWRLLTQAGLEAAQRVGDDYAQALMAASQAQLATDHRTPDVADRHLRALELARRAGWREGAAQMLAGLGRNHYEAGRLAEAADCLEQSFTVAEEAGAAIGAASAMGNLGIIREELGQLDRAAELHSRALAAFRALGVRPPTGVALNNLAMTMWATGRGEEARALLEESLAITREVGDNGGEAYALGVLSRIESDHEQALRYAGDALVLAGVAGDDREQAQMLCELGFLHLARHNDRTALDCFRRASEHAANAITKLPGVRAMIGRAAAEHRLGRAAEAHDLLRRALDGCREHGYRLVEGQALTVLAELELADGRPERARAAAERALEIRAETGHRLAAADPDPILKRLA